MIERYSAGNERRYVKLGLISAITAVNLKEDGSSPKEQPHFESSGKKVLDHLANPESLMHQINPLLNRKYRGVIEKAKELFPKFGSRPYLIKLLSVI